MHTLLKNLTIRYVNPLILLYFRTFRSRLLICELTPCHGYSGVYVGSKQLHMEMLQFVETNGLRPHIDRVFAFEDAMKALEYLGLGRHIGKVVVKVST